MDIRHNDDTPRLETIENTFYFELAGNRTRELRDDDTMTTGVQVTRPQRPSFKNNYKCWLRALTQPT